MKILSLRLAAGLILSLLAQAAVCAPMVLHQGAAADPPSLDPSIAAGSLASPVITDLFVGLLTRDADSRPIAGCAESWSVSEDGLTYTFRLRPDLRWSDGKPIGAEDFVYSFRRLMDRATASNMAGLFFFLKGGRDVYLNAAPPETLGVRAPDARTVVIELEHPAPFLLQLLANMQFAPVPRHVIEAHSRDWTRPGRMVSNGAFMLDERVPQNHIKLVKNPYFYDADNVRLDEVWWHPTQDLTASLRRFRAGDLDVILNFPPDEIDRIRETMPEALHITATLATYFLVLNTKRKPFDDVRVRRALALAIDRDVITSKLVRTGVKPAWSFASPEFNGYGGIELPDQKESPARRQAEARRLLREAGFGKSRPLTVPLLYDTQEENRKIMIAIASMWRDVGVITAMTNLEFGALNRRVRTRDYDVARWTYFASFDDAYSFLQLLDSRNPNNWPGWASQRYDALLAQSNRTSDSQQRAALLREAEAMMMKDHPLIPIYYYVGRRLISPQVKGWVDSPRGNPPSRYLWLEE